MPNRRDILLRATKYLSVILLLAILYVSFDFLIDLRPPGIYSSYRFTLRELPIDQPVWLKQDNLSIVLILRSRQLIETLKQPDYNLQDAASESSRQPEYAKNPLRSRHETYFVAYGRGTNLECPLKLREGSVLRETCSTAQYDFAGRAQTGKNRFQNLTIPDYTFNDNFTQLTINP